MSDLCSFDIGIHCEEFFVAPGVSKWDQMMDIIDDLGSSDIMDRCEVVSLDAVTDRVGTYDMENIIVNDMEFDEVWDDYHLTGEKRLKKMSWDYREVM